MNRSRSRRHSVEHDDVHRWLVSYADYMTLLFALFVVLYAMAIVHDKPFETITESLGRVFQADQPLTQNKGHGDDILLVNTKKSNKPLYGDGLLEDPGPELYEGENELSNIKDSQVGSNLSALEEELHAALFELEQSGYAKMQIDGDWLEIELNSGLLFPSGSSSATLAAKSILTEIYKVIGPATNFIRIRGYTDNQPINNEIFSSNWELSVYRATAILRMLEQMSLNPARMAIEGYGQYYPSADNSTAQGRAQNRKVVIAISKYGLQQAKLPEEPGIAVENLQNQVLKTESAAGEDAVKIIQLESGGIRITTRDEEQQPEPDN
ncbi:flagellar motor protein MotB [Thalassomonas actiniarum]|uniref:OmpA family protein n=1 Tax=Thalassomonas actiniarum TaxID=485447 RepID=A0AAF0C4X8_9GAMM|nr:flagellar motor protein MotB [Thalassomonas actiniarum]WDE00511.1 OmpA family protein [Thalassomonas actiniarum]